LNSSLIQINHHYFKKLIDWKGYSAEPTVGNGLFKIQGYKSYNNLLSINEIFSKGPRPMPIDRTLNVNVPFKYTVRRPWKTPGPEISLEQALLQRVHSIITQWPQERINIFWSGGIDSTSVVNAFLINAPDLSQLRILYSPFSYYEHPEYMTFLKKFPQVELVDLSGTVYLDTQFDGVFITGDSGDEMHASLDDSFFKAHGYDSLFTPWQDFFQKQNPDPAFLNFCQHYFSSSGLPIHTVLEARWWFYANTKLNCVLFNKLPFWLDYPNFNFDRVLGFFDCEEYENHIAYNISSVIANENYNTWKQPLKNYCYNFDGCEQWRTTKAKVHSGQLTTYINKKTALKQLQWIAILEDGTRIHTPNLPWLSKIEFDRKYGTTLDYLWNLPDAE
jgi:hypothetical protein